MPKVLGFSEQVKKQATCKHCGAINEYTPNDVRNLYTGKDYSGGSDCRDGFNCANCGKEVTTRAW